MGKALSATRGLAPGGLGTRQPPATPGEPLWKADCGYCDSISQNANSASTFELSQCRQCKERLPGPRTGFWVTSGSLSLKTAASTYTEKKFRDCFGHCWTWARSGIFKGGDLNPGERHSRDTRDDGTVTLCTLRAATVLSCDCRADFGRRLTKKVMSHSRDGPGVTVPSRTNIVPLTEVWNPPASITPP